MQRVARLQFQRNCAIFTLIISPGEGSLTVSVTDDFSRKLNVRQCQLKQTELCGGTVLVEACRDSGTLRGMSTRPPGAWERWSSRDGRMSPRWMA